LIAIWYGRTGPGWRRSPQLNHNAPDLGYAEPLIQKLTQRLHPHALSEFAMLGLSVSKRVFC
jgi:hypothetical protein